MKKIIALLFFLSFSLMAQKLPKQLTMKLKSFKVNAPSKEAFAELMKQCKKEDPDNKGILIIYKGKKNKRINLNLTDVPVNELLRLICLSSGYKYKITGRTVNIVDK